MPLYEPYLPSRYLVPLLDILAQHGPQTVARVLREAGLGADKLRPQAEAVTFREFDRLLGAAARELACEDLGFQLGQRITMDDHDALSLVLRQCRTADELLRMIARFRRLVTNGFFFVYERNASHGELTFRPAAPLGREALYIFEELFAVSFHRDVTALVDKEPGVEIFLSMPAPPHAERYRRLRPTRFHFEASALPEVRCRLPLRLLDKPLIQPAVASTAGAATLTTTAHLSERSREYGKWVALMLREAEGVQPKLTELARMLNISPRSLNRHLQGEGTSLRALNNSVRFERACQLLANTDEPVGQIAHRLGYASPVSFYVAFNKQAGTGPREFRAAAKLGVA